VHPVGATALRHGKVAPANVGVVPVQTKASTGKRRSRATQRYQQSNRKRSIEDYPKIRRTSTASCPAAAETLSPPRVGPDTTSVGVGRLAKTLSYVLVGGIEPKSLELGEFGKRNGRLSPAYSALGSKAVDDGSAKLGPLGPRPH
jgi:hypothetical protein